MHGSPNLTEITNYLGLVTFALAIGWLVVVLRRRNGMAAITAGLVSAFVVGFLFALPSPVAGIPMPSKLLWHVLPAFRVPSRWDPLLMTALLPLAALGLQSVRRVVGVAAVVVLMGLSFFELSTHRVGHFRTVPVPPEYTALERNTPKGILAEYPLGYSDIYRLWQRVHGRPLVNGAPDGSLADQARFMILDPAQAATAPALALLGVTAVAIHPGGPADTPLQPRDPASTPGYRLVGRFPDGSSVWAVVAPPAPALVTFPGGFAAPRLVAGDVVGYPLVATSGVALLELRANRPERQAAVPNPGRARRAPVHVRHVDAFRRDGCRSARRVPAGAQGRSCANVRSRRGRALTVARRNGSGYRGPTRDSVLRRPRLLTRSHAARGQQ
jgi:hypothetical protein